MKIVLHKDVRYNPNTGGDVLQFKVTEPGKFATVPEAIGAHLVKFGYATEYVEVDNQVKVHQESKRKNKKKKAAE